MATTAVSITISSCSGSGVGPGLISKGFLVEATIHAAWLPVMRDILNSGRV